MYRTLAPLAPLLRAKISDASSFQIHRPLIFLPIASRLRLRHLLLTASRLHPFATPAAGTRQRPAPSILHSHRMDASSPSQLLCISWRPLLRAPRWLLPPYRLLLILLLVMNSSLACLSCHDTCTFHWLHLWSRFPFCFFWFGVPSFSLITCRCPLRCRASHLAVMFLRGFPNCCECILRLLHLHFHNVARFEPEIFVVFVDVAFCLLQCYKPLNELL